MEGTWSGGEAIVTKKKKKKEPINVILMRKSGRMYSFDISGGILLAAFLFAVLFAVASVLAINYGVNLYYQNQDLQAEMSRLKTAAAEFEVKPMMLSQYKALEKEMSVADAMSLGEEEDPASTPDETVEAGPANSGGEAAENVSGGNDEQRPERLGPTPLEDSPIDAENLKLRVNDNNSEVKYQFRITNVTPGSKEITGLLFIMLIDASHDPPTIIVHPEVDVENFEPQDYKRGTLFSIKYGKTVQGKIDLPEGVGPIDEAWIIAYTEEGEPLIRKLLTVADD